MSGYTRAEACAVAIANIHALRNDGVIDRVRDETAPYFHERFATLGEHPLIGEARSLGLVGAVEIVQDKAGIPLRISVKRGKEFLTFKVVPEEVTQEIMGQEINY